MLQVHVVYKKSESILYPVSQMSKSPISQKVKGKCFAFIDFFRNEKDFKIV